jgi:hypothetical protein
MWCDIKLLLSNKEYAQRVGYLVAFISAPLFLLFIGNSPCYGVIGGCYGLSSAFITFWGLSYFTINGLNEDTRISRKKILFITSIAVGVYLVLFSALLLILFPLAVNLFSNSNLDPKKALDTVKTIDNAGTAYDIFKLFK